MFDIGGAVGGIVGGVLGYEGVKDTNEANENIANARNAMEIEEAQKARVFGADQAKIGREFNERMSSTAVQRRMADMKAAGINPILAGKYDASSPVSAQPATAKANAHGYEAKNKMQGMIDNLASALSLKKLATDIKSVEATTDLTKRKKDLSDPVNRMLDILDNVIQGATNAPQKYQEQVRTLKQELTDLLKSIGEGAAKSQGYHVPEKQPLTKETKQKYKLPGVKDEDRKPFGFAR